VFGKRLGHGIGAEEKGPPRGDDYLATGSRRAGWDEDADDSWRAALLGTHGRDCRPSPLANKTLKR
jgi:hypothetical protein